MTVLYNVYEVMILSKEKMIRKQIYLEAKQNDEVKILSTRKGKTEAEIIREAIDHYLYENKPMIDDPLTELIGIVDADETMGSIQHDEVIYGVERTTDEKN